MIETLKQAGIILYKPDTDKILEEMFIDKWDGKLPEVMAGEDGLSILLPTDSE